MRKGGILNEMRPLTAAFILFTSMAVTSCSSQQAQSPHPKPADLPIVQVRLDSNRYFLPECEKAMEIPARLLLELPTVQEAELSGYAPAATCSNDVIKQRLAKERELFGKMQPTETTERRRAEALERGH